MALALSKTTDRIVLKDADLVADGDPDVTYTVRPLTAQAAAQIRAQVGRNQNEAVYALLDHCLLEWTGVELDGQPAPCTREHKIMLPLTVASEIVERASSRVVAQEAAKKDSFRNA